MDLLGGLGDHDQLVSARTENAVLTKKVKELTGRVRVLELENSSLRAEVEMYRAEATASDAKATEVSDVDGDSSSMASTHFVRSGDGSFVRTAVTTLEEPHGGTNPLCCALTSNDAVLLTGGADSTLRATAWGAPSSSTRVFHATAPVVGCAAAHGLAAGGCMDGSVHVSSSLLRLATGTSKTTASLVPLGDGNVPVVRKYVKCVAWSPTEPILATASADGLVTLTRVTAAPSWEEDDDGPRPPTMISLESFHLDGPVEALCFLDDGKTLCLHTRGTPYLSYFHLDDQCRQVQHSLNVGVTGGFDTHVSFTVMDLAPSPDGRYLAAATDVDRNLILRVHSSQQVRNFYGHKNDGFSQPKVAWARSGHYLYGNTQEGNEVCVWDCASSRICHKLEGHTGQLRDLCSSSLTDTLATVSYDKTAKIWLCDE